MKVVVFLMKKILTRVAVVVVVLLALLAALLVRPSVPLARLEPRYLTDDSSYYTATILSLDDQPLSVQIHYQDYHPAGEEVVVLIHGAFSSSHTFIPWAEQLVNEGYRVLLIDQPNFGLSGGFADNVTSYRRTAEVLRDLLDDLSITKIHLAGNSLGGAVSWYFASEYPSMVQTLTLIDAVYPTTMTRPDLSWLTDRPWLVSIFSTFSPRFLVKEILQTAYGDPERLTDELLTRYYELLLKEGTRQAILTSTSEPEPSPGYLERLQSLTMPVYLMWGALDTWIPIDVSEAFQSTLQLPDNHLFIYDDLGHVPMEEDPTTTLTDYLTILRSLD